jgi:hypothetical protein
VGTGWKKKVVPKTNSTLPHGTSTAKNLWTGFAKKKKNVLTVALKYYTLFSGRLWWKIIHMFLHFSAIISLRKKKYFGIVISLLMFLGTRSFESCCPMIL